MLFIGTHTHAHTHKGEKLSCFHKSGKKEGLLATRGPKANLPSQGQRLS